jgi:hypothetical protein
MGTLSHVEANNYSPLTCLSIVEAPLIGKTGYSFPKGFSYQAVLQTFLGSSKAILLQAGTRNGKFGQTVPFSKPGLNLED